MIEKWLKLYYNERIYLEVLTYGENLVVSVFSTESESLSVLCGFEGFPPNSGVKVAQIALVKNEKFQSHRWKKNAMTLKIQRRMQPRRCSLLTLSSFWWSYLASCLVMVLASLYGFGCCDTVDTAEAESDWRCVSKVIDGETQPLCGAENNEAVIDAYF